MFRRSQQFYNNITCLPIKNKGQSVLIPALVKIKYFNSYRHFSFHIYFENKNVFLFVRIRTYILLPTYIIPTNTQLSIIVHNCIIFYFWKCNIVRTFSSQVDKCMLLFIYCLYKSLERVRAFMRLRGKSDMKHTYRILSVNIMLSIYFIQFISRR